MKRPLFSAFGVGIAALVGCAVGSELDASPAMTDLATVPLEAGAGDGSGITMQPPSQKPASDQDAGSDAQAPDSDAGDGAPPTCPTTNTCGAATDLGKVSGDTGSDSKLVDGNTSQWFTVRVTENDTSLSGRKLRLTATLQSPAGANFDVYVYVPGGDTQECSVASKSSTNTTGLDTAGVSWHDNLGPDDDRTVTVEVRQVSGTCDAPAKWTLNLYGNQ